MEIQNLQISSPARRLYSDINLSFKASEVWGILGQNGTGKTTLLNTLCGLHDADSGSISLLDKPLQTYSPRELSQLAGYLFQLSSESFPQSVYQYCSAGLHPHRNRWQPLTDDENRLIMQSLKRVDLHEFCGRSMDSLSGGEKRRAEIASLLIQNPRIWLLDEPVNHLDIAHQISLLELIISQAHKNDGTVISVLHDANLADRFCSHVLLLFADGSYQAGKKDDLLNENNLSRLFAHPLKIIQQGSARAFTAL